MASSRLERIGTILTRKLNNAKLHKSLSEVLNEMKADYNVMKYNNEKIEQFTANFLKCMHKMTLANKQNFKVLSELQTTFEKKVEGLLTRGAMKPDDRPLWFDVYRAFPPLVEPKFARPAPEIKPIKQILYHEDVIRAKFQSKGLGIGTVNMLNSSGETQIKRLVQQYEKLKLEGLPEDELIEKSASIVESERQEIAKTFKTTATPASTVKNPDSVSAQILSESNLKNIFEDK